MGMIRCYFCGAKRKYSGDLFPFCDNCDKILPFYCTTEKSAIYQLEAIRSFELTAPEEHLKVLGITPDNSSILVVNYDNNSFIHLAINKNSSQEYPVAHKLKKMTDISYSFNDVVMIKGKDVFLYDHYGRIIGSFKVKHKFDRVINSNQTIALINRSDSNFMVLTKSPLQLCQEGHFREPFFQVDSCKGVLDIGGSIFSISVKLSGNLSTNSLQRKYYNFCAYLEEGFSALYRSLEFFSLAKTCRITGNLLIDNRYRLLYNDVFTTLVGVNVDPTFSPTEEYLVSIDRYKGEMCVKFVDLEYGTATYIPYTKILVSSNKKSIEKCLRISLDSRIIVFVFRGREKEKNTWQFYAYNVNRIVTEGFIEKPVKFLHRYVRKEELKLLVRLFTILDMKCPTKGEYKIGELKKIFDASNNKVSKIDLKNELWRFPRWKSELTEPILNFEDLETLILAKNGLKTIPKNLGQLTNLRFLDLSKNKITEINGELEKLSKLEELDLSKNKITTIPEKIFKLQNLKLLNLEKNKIEDIPTELLHLASIKQINLRKNPIAKTIKKKKMTESFYRWMNEFSNKGGELIY